MTKDEALKLALEVLEQLQGGCTDHDDGTVEAITVWCPEVIDAIKQALAAPVQEPVATLWQHGETGRTRITMPGDITDCDARWFKAADLYTTPPTQPVPVQEPEYWNVLDPTGNVVASETDAIRGWARIAGSYKPTVEGLLGFHDQGWRVLPKVPPPAQPAVPDAIGPNEDELPAYAAGWNDCRQAMLEMMK